MEKQHKKEWLLKITESNGQLKIYERCQSCAKKFSSITTYGTNKDSSYNSAFCKSCFQKGEFTEPDLTKEQLITKIRKEGYKVRFFGKKMINRLDRWRVDLYN